MRLETKKKRITPRQRKLAEEIVKNATLDKPKNGGQLLESAGYVGKTLNTPARTIQQQGVQSALEEFGFSENNAKEVVAKILLDENVDPNARLKASDQVFKVSGSYAPEKRANVNANFDLNKPAEDEELEKLRQQYVEGVKKLSQK